MLITKFLKWVDSESLRLPQAIIYSAFWLAGIYMLTLNRTPSVVTESMGPGWHFAWTAMLALCPVVVLVGYRMTDQYTGLSLQLGNNAAITLCLLGYGGALIEQGQLGKGTFALFTTLALVLVTAIITLRDWRRLQFIEAVAKELDETPHEL
ncbi:membrane protein [Gordonia phage Bantam]|uniref:Membrane protein n=1 Tax=Gordonia phage Bantam TaxID=1887641 RepID=A0A1B3AY97_9CAUD|nr:membrane protein [Gordonia phage Bantam]AOE43724.1 membrane protein [Gordonia phage Bantam]